MILRRNLLLFLILPVFLAAVLGLTWWYVRSRAVASREDFRYLPADATIAACLDLAGLRESSLVRRALRSQAPPQWEADYAEFVRETGFNLERDLDVVSLAISGPQGRRSVHAVLRGRFDRERIRQYASRHRQATSSYRSRTIDTFVGPSGRVFRLVFLGRDRLGFSNAADARAIEDMIRQAGESGRSLRERLEELHVFDHVPAGAQAWVAADWERLGSVSVPAGLGSGGAFSAELLRGARLGLLGARVGDSDVEAHLAAEFASAADAQKAAETLSALRTLLKGLAARRGGAAGGELARALEGLSISVEANAAVIRWKIAGRVLEQLLSQSAAWSSGAAPPQLGPSTRQLPHPAPFGQALEVLGVGH